MDIPFRGAREYLHGTDIYQFLMDGGGGDWDSGPVQLQFHGLLRRRGEILIGVDDLAEWRKSPRYRGEGRIGPKDNSLQVVLLETDEDGIGRKECNEVEVVLAAAVDAGSRSAVLKAQNEGLMVERVVFLNKRLHSVVLPTARGQWLFAKLDLVQALPETGERELKLVMKQVLGNRCTKTEILIDEVSYGFIIFSTNQ